MADPVEARFDVSFEDPFGTASVAQYRVALPDGVSRRSFFPESVGVGIGGCFRDGIEGEQVECLHRPVFHRGDATSILPPHPNCLRDSSPSPIRITPSAVNASRSFACAEGLIPIS